MLINTYDLSFWFFQVDTFCPDKSFAQLDIFSVSFEKIMAILKKKKQKFPIWLFFKILQPLMEIWLLMLHNVIASRTKTHIKLHNVTPAGATECSASRRPPRRRPGSCAERISGAPPGSQRICPPGRPETWWPASSPWRSSAPDTHKKDHRETQPSWSIDFHTWLLSLHLWHFNTVLYDGGPLNERMRAALYFVLFHPNNICTFFLSS